MESPVQKFFKLNLLIMRLCGFYPPKRYKFFYKLYTCVVYICCTVPVPTLAALHLILDENVDLAEIGDSSFLIFQGGCLIFKLLPFIFNAEEVRKVIYMMELPVFNNIENQEKIGNSLKICKYLTWIFLGFCVLTLATWTATPFFGNTHKFPIEIWLPFDPTLNIKIYFSVYLLIVIGVGNGTFANGVIDPLVSEHLSQHAKTEIQAYPLQNIDFCKKYILEQKIIYDKIKSCVIHHTAIVEFTKCYENVCSSVVFTQFIAGVIVICVSCLQLTIVEPFTYTFFVMSSFLYTMLMEIFLFCYFGASLFEESNSITTAIYMGNWYQYNLKSKKALLILMERSKKPLTVTAGKILDLSLDTFTTILRRAYSLLAVLNSYEIEP